MCSRGKWKAGKWRGPDRSLLRTRFHAWAESLFGAADVNSAGGGRKELTEHKVQLKHFQNLFIFAERPHLAGGAEPPMSSTWSEVDEQANPTRHRKPRGPRDRDGIVPNVASDGRCKFFAAGRCKKGSECNFEHVVEPGTTARAGGADVCSPVEPASVKTDSMGMRLSDVQRTHPLVTYTRSFWA